MPRYDYQCASCRHLFEIRQSFDSIPVADCPRCGRPSQRRFHSPTVIYKGSGWYTTDYAKKSMQIGKDVATEEAPKPSSDKKEQAPKPSSDKKEDKVPEESKLTGS